MYVFLLPGFDPRGPQKLRERFREFDYVGAVLSIAALVCTITAINFGGTSYAWDSGRIIALFVVAGVCVVAFAVQQALALLTRASDRMFPVPFLKMKEPVLLFLAMAAANAGGFIAIYYIPTYFAFVRGDHPVQSAVRLLPLIVFISTIILVNGAMISKLGYYQPWYLAGGALVLIGGILMCKPCVSVKRLSCSQVPDLVDVNTSTAHIYGYEVLLGIGTGSYIQAGYGVIQAIIEPANMAYALSFMMLGRYHLVRWVLPCLRILPAQLLAISLGLSISGAVFLNKAIDGLSKLLPGVSHDEIQSAVLGASGNLLDTLSPEARKSAIVVLVDAIDRTYVLLIYRENPPQAPCIRSNLLNKRNRADYNHSYVIVFVSGIVGLLSAIFMNVRSDLTPSAHRNTNYFLAQKTSYRGSSGLSTTHFNSGSGKVFALRQT